MTANDTASSATAGAELSSGDSATPGTQPVQRPRRGRGSPLPSPIVRSSASNRARAKSRSPCANTGPSIASHPAGPTYDGSAATSSLTEASVVSASRPSPARTYSSGACAAHSSTGRGDSFSHARMRLRGKATRSPPRGRRRRLSLRLAGQNWNSATATGTALPPGPRRGPGPGAASASEPPRRRTSRISCPVAALCPACPVSPSAFRGWPCSEIRSPVSLIAARRRPGGRWRRASSRTRLGMGTPWGTRGKAPRGKPATTVAAMAEIEMPEGLYLSLSGVVRPGTGGQTRALLMRNRLLTQKAGVETTLLTFDSPPVYHDVRAGLEDRDSWFPACTCSTSWDRTPQRHPPRQPAHRGLAAAAGRLCHRGRAAPRRHRLPDEVPPAARGRAAPGDQRLPPTRRLRLPAYAGRGGRRLDAGLAVHPRQPPGRPNAHLAEEGWLAPAVAAPARR